MEFKSLSDLEKYLKKAVADSLGKEVETTVRKCEQKNIESEVYQAYSPEVYVDQEQGENRRGYDGGLIADENIVGVVDANNLTLTVTNETPPNPNARDKSFVTTDKDLAELIEYGQGYNGYEYDFFNKGDKYGLPRPFTQKTIEELQDTKQHVEALKKGLQRNKINVK